MIDGEEEGAIRTSGWGRRWPNHKFHYFDNSCWSLCGRYGFWKLRSREIYDSWNCLTCVRILEGKLRRKKNE